MSYIHATATFTPQKIPQTQTKELALKLFKDSNLDLEKLLKVFDNTKIESRPILESLDFYFQEKSFSEKNSLFLKHSLSLSEAVCKDLFQKAQISPKEIDAVIVVTTSGFVTPTLDARLIDILGLREDVLRIPIVGLGCAGGVYGLSRARELSVIYPNHKVLLLTVETCTLTFRPNDKSKTNFIAFSLFSDGAAAVLISNEYKPHSIHLLSNKTYRLPNSLRVMGWDVEEDGLKVVFDASIPFLIKKYFRNFYDEFLSKQNLSQVQHYLFHPGGRKVLEAFEEVLGISSKELIFCYKVLQENGNMSSPTVLFVLDEFLRGGNFMPNQGGIFTAMGPGFSTELLSFQTT